MIATISFSVTASYAQINDNVIEEMMSSNPEQVDFEIISPTNLNDSKKYNLNTLTQEDLQRFPFLSEREINSIINHRTQFKGFIDVLELQQCDISYDNISRLLEFVEIPFARRSHKEQRFTHQASSTHLNQNPTQTNKTFDGDGSKIICRYRFNNQNGFQIGITAEKDAGERILFGKPLQMFDYQSGYLAYNNKKYLSLILGDFTANFGQGLVIGQGFSTSKSALVMNIANLSKGINPYRSLDENHYFRGFAVSKILKQMEYTVFLSRLRRDANLDGDNIVSLNYTGLHRNSTEYQYKNSILTTEYGSRVKYSFKNHVIGLSIIGGIFDKKVAKNERLDARFDFFGNQYLKGGIHHSSQFNAIRFFGEFAVDDQLNSAFIEGLQWSLGRNLDASILYRNFQPGFNAIHAQSFGEVNEPQNEQGLYFALRLSKKHWNFSTYSDFFKKLWPSYGNLSSTDGSEQMIEAHYRFSRKTHFYLRYRQKTKTDYSRIKGDLVLTNALIERYRLHAETTLDNEIRLRSRIEFSKYTSYNQSTTKGIMIYYDLQKKSIIKNLDLTIRLTLSDVEDYNSRIYVFENDLPLTYSMVFYDAEIWRLYALFHYRLSGNLDFWVKFAHQFQQSALVFNEGQMHANNEKLNQYKFQLRYRI